MGARGVFCVLVVFWGLYLAGTRIFRVSVLRIVPVLSSISGFDTAGTACTRSSVPLIFISRYSQYLGREYVLQSSQYSE